MTSLGLDIDVAARGALKTKMHLAPTLLQSLEVLTLPVSDLVDYANKAAEANPLLEINYDSELFTFQPLPSEEAYQGALDAALDEHADGSDAVPDRSGAAGARQGDAGAGNPHDGAAGDDLSAGSTPAGGTFEERAPSDGASTRGGQGPGSIASAVDWDFSRIEDDCCETETLQEYLHLQASDLHLDPERSRIMDAVIESISEDGYFDADIASVAFELGVDEPQVSEALACVQRMQPAGVGARNLAECLLLQVEDGPYASATRRMISGHLEDLAHNRLSRLSRSLGVSTDEVAAIKRTIMAMNPRPGASFYQRATARYVVPDIIVKRENGEFSIEVVGAGQPCLTLSDEYVDLLADDTLMKEARDYLTQKRTEAENVLRNLDQRRRTLQLFSVFLMDYQRQYFVSEGRHLAPMTMQQAADALGVHVSTISRAVQDKYIQTPWGTFPLKDFFTRALPQGGDGASGAEEDISSFEIKRMIKELIAEEAADHPLSDAKITEVLNGRGIAIKRRTVAKYRSAMGIAGQSERRWAHGGPEDRGKEATGV